MPKKLKTEGLPPVVMKIINTPTHELKYFLKFCEPADIVAAHIALKNEDIYRAKQRAIKSYIEGPSDQKSETRLKQEMQTAWFIQFSAEWEKTCEAIRHKALA